MSQAAALQAASQAELDALLPSGLDRAFKEELKVRHNKHYGVVLRYKGHSKELCGGFRQTTNNRVEPLAYAEGLKALKRRCSVALCSDFKYVVNGMAQGWTERWHTKGWKLASGHDVRNADLWQQLVELCQQHAVEFRRVKGHSGNQDNERCDQLAILAAQGRDLPVDIGYKKT